MLFLAWTVAIHSDEAEPGFRQLVVKVLAGFSLGASDFVNSLGPKPALLIYSRTGFWFRFGLQMNR